MWSSDHCLSPVLLWIVLFFPFRSCLVVCFVASDWFPWFNFFCLCVLLLCRTSLWLVFWFACHVLLVLFFSRFVVASSLRSLLSLLFLLACRRCAVCVVALFAAMESSTCSDSADFAMSACRRSVRPRLAKSFVVLNLPNSSKETIVTSPTIGALSRRSDICSVT